MGIDRALGGSVAATRNFLLLAAKGAGGREIERRRRDREGKGGRREREGESKREMRRERRRAERGREAYLLPGVSSRSLQSHPCKAHQT